MGKACILFLALQYGCVEPFEINADGDFEDVLVVEGTVTNEVKRQTVRLSRSSPLEESGIITENNAMVTVKDGNGGVFFFF